MKRFRTKKVAAVVIATAIALGGAGAALAYFTSSGTGSGTATVGTAGSWTVGESGTPSGGPLYPDAAIGGANIQTDSYTVSNPNAGSQDLTSVVIEVSPTFSVQDANLDPACTAADFSVGGQAVGTAWTDTSLHGDYISGASETGTVTVELIDNGANQDSCEGQTVPLVFTAS